MIPFFPVKTAPSPPFLSTFISSHFFSYTPFSYNSYIHPKTAPYLATAINILDYTHIVVTAEGNFKNLWKHKTSVLL
jgi:hypothetical protein